jgi:hypothetical protein
MDRPMAWYGCEGVIYAEKSLANGDTVEQVFAKLTYNFNRQSIFRKLQSFAGVCGLYWKTSDAPTRVSIRGFLIECRDAELPLLSQVECRCIRIARKLLVISVYPVIEKRITEELQSAPELVRFVQPPTGFNESLDFEVRLHKTTFERLATLSEPELRIQLNDLETFENSIEPAFAEASKQSTLYQESSLTWFQSYGKGRHHFAFKNILRNCGIE